MPDLTIGHTSLTDTPKAKGSAVSKPRPNGNIRKRYVDATLERRIKLAAQVAGDEGVPILFDGIVQVPEACMPNDTLENGTAHSSADRT